MFLDGGQIWKNVIVVAKQVGYGDDDDDDGGGENYHRGEEVGDDREQDFYD